MTWFLILCAVMVLAALVLVARPLLKRRDAGANEQKKNRIAVVCIAIAVPAMAAVLYASTSNWNWHPPPPSAQQLKIEEMVGKLEARMRETPEDVQGWKMLGRSYTVIAQYGKASAAYQKAYDLTGGEDVEAATGLGEALALADENALTGRAGELFEKVLEKNPTHAKALWYGAIAAMNQNRLAVARDRFQALLAQNPPEQLRTLLERQVQDLNAQLGGPANAAAQITPASNRAIKVSVSVAPAIAAKLKGPLPLFVLARDPEVRGPPLAAVRKSSADLPAVIELTDRDAMLAGRSIATATRVEVVARLSQSGAPTAQSGDFFGSATYAFDRQGEVGAVNIVIDQITP